MITIICSSQHPLDDFKKTITKSCGIDPKKIQFLGYENKGEFSLSEIYNRGLKESVNDIVVFLHNDITLETNQWGKKLLKIFEKNPEYGIIGVAGTKDMPSSGMWWENPKKMYGRVKHTHEGKSWVSAYSEDLGTEIEEVVVVDGVFFAVNKTKLKQKFDESVKGFHFYEITFCFKNFLEGVKLGVTTSLKINHQSIGMVNESWENNRKNFAEEFKDNLPVSLKKKLRKGEKLKVLIGCLSFANYTGSELYVFELAKNLIKNGCEVSICSNLGQPLSNLAKSHGIKLYTLQEPPGYKLGDGKWLLKTTEGEIPSTPNTLYRLEDKNFHVVHLNHKPVTEHLLRLFSDTPILCSIHSEVISLEEPVIAPEIKKYIAIRPEIKEHLKNSFNIQEDKIGVIYNPIDENKFKPKPNTNKKDKKRILFVGTIDYLRRKTIEDLIKTTKEENSELWIVGKENDNYLPSLLENNNHVSYFKPTSDVEKYINESDETAGILLGRTTIEGWMCGKKGWIYDVDSNGNILSKKLHDVPDDLYKFKSDYVIKQILEEYIKII